MPVLNTEALIKNRVTAIRKYHEDAGIERAELDVSGGIDSAVMLMLLAKALGPDKVTTAYSSINSSSESRSRARLVSEAAGVRLPEVDATGAYNVLVDAAMGALDGAGYDMDEIKARCKADPTIMGSLRSCLRAPLGRFMGRLTGNALRHGTGNEDEDRWLRFYQKGGDGEVDTNPLAMLSKGEVYQLAVALGVPEEIITALPTPDLQGSGEAHNDEAELTAKSGVEWSYSRVDPKTGKYVKVGTIERMSRFLDRLNNTTSGEPVDTYEAFVFGDRGSDYHASAKDIEEAGLTVKHVESSRTWERITRHKMNPNCPSLGSRKELLDAGLITNELPEV